jgi:hypothetical protein
MIKNQLISTRSTPYKCKKIFKFENENWCILIKTAIKQSPNNLHYTLADTNNTLENFKKDNFLLSARLSLEGKYESQFQLIERRLVDLKLWKIYKDASINDQCIFRKNFKHAVEKGNPDHKWKNWQRNTTQLCQFVDMFTPAYALMFLCNISDFTLKSGSKYKFSQIDKWWHNDKVEIDAYRLSHSLRALQEHSESTNLYKNIVFNNDEL